MYYAQRVLNEKKTRVIYFKSCIYTDMKKKPFTCKTMDFCIPTFKLLGMCWTYKPKHD